MTNQPTAGIYTLGCKVNQYESEAIAEKMQEVGFLMLPPQEYCDVYIINTCTVTGESDRKARQFIRRAVHQNPNAYILVTGCFSQISPEVVAAIPGVDYVCGNAEKQSVVAAALDLIRQGRKNGSPALQTAAPDALGFEPMCIRRFDRTRAYLKIEDGCESRCAYCIIPAARGKIRSKPLEDVIAEVSALVAGGCREVVLTGIETASWGKDLNGPTLADLLERVDAVPGIGRVRLGSLDPSLIRPAFVERIARLRSLAPHFHLSVQSGSSAVLARMRRKYNADMALAGMELLRQAIPNVQFTTDIIVGFPQETDAEFEETLAFIRKARFLMIHVFPYSRRKGTPAATMPGQVPDPVKREREKRLSQVQAEIRRSILNEMIGKSAEVLFETRENGTWTGHSPNFLEVVCKTDLPLHGEIRTVRLTESDGDRCYGVLADN